uniref:Glycosyl hydrolase 108 n=1 Tax=Candidatus Kentrum sp. DK TaxID=2126562 RepID=A0A450TLV6_9GAMM|nr:MAG: Glycosyl hydrolase 108 [Candidatus Kentron sp. DK]
MADFGQAFEKTMRNEGGFQLHTVRGDPGGMTYAGISRRHHPDWEQANGVRSRIEASCRLSFSA